jgi:hypothetical protein
MPARVPLKFAYWVPNVSGGLVTSAARESPLVTAG